MRLSLALAESHLASAELQTSHLNYDEAAAEAGKYWALVEDVFIFLSKQKVDSNKTRDLYKRVELTLRAHGPRLSIMRRSTPAAYAIWIKETEDFARQGRTEALNSFYGHTVVRDRPAPERRQLSSKQRHPAGKKTMTRRTLFWLAQLCLLFSCYSTARALPPQARDYLTPKEIDLVKDAQELDKRIDVFIKAANRRLVVIKGLDPNTKEIKKDAEFWGDLPAGTRSELVGDIARILDAAIDNIDDVSYRDEKNPALPRALRKLAGAASHLASN